MAVTFHETDERCKECGRRLHWRLWGRGVLWMCLKCLKLWEE